MTCAYISPRRRKHVAQITLLGRSVPERVHCMEVGQRVHEIARRLPTTPSDVPARRPKRAAERVAHYKEGLTSPCLDTGRSGGRRPLERIHRIAGSDEFLWSGLS